MLNRLTNLEAAERLAKNRNSIADRWLQEVHADLLIENGKVLIDFQNYILILIEQAAKLITTEEKDFQNKMSSLAKLQLNVRRSLSWYTIDEIFNEYQSFRKQIFQILSTDDCFITEKLHSIINEIIDGSLKAYVLEFSKIFQATIQKNHSSSIEMEKSSQKKQYELEQALRMRDEFLSIASHELRTPLTALYLQLQFLEKNTRPENTRQSVVNSINTYLIKAVRHAFRVSEMIDRLLDLSKIRTNSFSLEIVTIDLCFLLKETISRVIGSNCTSSVEIDLPDCGEVIAYIDPIRIEQLVTNLLTNAVKYGLGRPISIRLEKLGSDAILTVSDQGIGISKEDQKLIFGQFVRATEMKRSESMGLGLFIVFEIALAHGGSVNVNSELGAGATFTVTLPTKRII